MKRTLLSIFILTIALSYASNSGTNNRDHSVRALEEGPCRGHIFLYGPKGDLIEKVKYSSKQQNGKACSDEIAKLAGGILDDNPGCTVTYKVLEIWETF